MPRRNSKAEIIFVLTIVWFLLKSHMHVMLLKSWRFSLQQLKMSPSIFVVTCFLHFLWWLNTILRNIKKGELIIWCCRVFLMSSKRLCPVMKKEKFSLQMLEDYWISKMKSFLKRMRIFFKGMTSFVKMSRISFKRINRTHGLKNCLRRTNWFLNIQWENLGECYFQQSLKKIIKTKKSP